MKYYIRTIGERTLDKSYSQIPYTLLVDNKRDAISNFIESLFVIGDEECVLLEDDLILCSDFEKELEKAINQYPNRIINFFQSPCIYKGIEESANICFNQCTYYPSNTASKIAPLMRELRETKFQKTIQYSVVEAEALRELNLTVVQYRPHLVQHLDFDTILFKETTHWRRSVYFIEYLKQLGINYEEASAIENQRTLRKIRDEHFKLLKDERMNQDENSTDSRNG